MTRLEQIRNWVKEYQLGYYFNPGGIEFFCPAFPDCGRCQTSEYVSDEDPNGIYQDDEGFKKLSDWIEKNKENFKREKPKGYTYYSEGIIEKWL